MPFHPKQLYLYPKEPGVYLMKDATGKVIYIGKSKDIQSRLRQYFSKRGDSRPMIPFLLSQIAHIDTLVVSSEKEALLLENTLIKKHQPKFNAFLKDDKTFISLMINHHHPWPMVRLVRYKGKPKEDGLYFGPYTNAYAARQTFELMCRLFPLRQCSDEELKRRTRPCLLYSIKRCIAPCVQKCTSEEYSAFVKKAIQFLKGQDKEILKELQEEMQKASDALEFERAAAIHQTIRHIEHVIGSSKQKVVKAEGKDRDVLGIYREGSEVVLVQLLFRQGNLTGSEHYSFSKVMENDEEILRTFLLQHYPHSKDLPQEILIPIPFEEIPLISEIFEETLPHKISLLCPQKGEKRALIEMAEKNATVIFHQEKDQKELKEKMLLDLQDTFKLNRFPKRIECFDTSNISGTDLVACMVAFTEGEKDKSRTRLYKIKEISKGDDYAAMHQVLSRRLLKAKEEEDLPDLILLDGGKGQLGIALNVFKELDIASVDVLAIAKEEGRHDKGMTMEKVYLPHHKEPITLNERSPLLFFLQKIRDEAHRMAISFHRKRREKRILVSSLEKIPGIGKVKQVRLLKHFGSLQRIKTATEKELSQVKGLTKKDINALLELQKIKKSE